MFASFLRLQPFFPAALEHENVFELRLIAQSFRHFATRIATLAAAINDDTFLRRPILEKLRQQFVPPIFIQRERAGNVIAGEIFIRPGIHPDNVFAPCARLSDRSQF